MQERFVSKVDDKYMWVFTWEGFEMSAESRHVLEISEKLANFNIDTDTDGNISTDVGKCWAFFTLQLLPM